jgi:hypothetical protein
MLMALNSGHLRYGNAIYAAISDEYQYHALPYIVQPAERLRNMYKNVIASAYSYV